jgi:hypothetical protein
MRCGLLSSRQECAAFRGAHSVVLTLEGTGPTGAVQVLGGGRAWRVHLEHFTIRNARALGLVARQADLTVRDLVVDGVRAELNGNGQSSLGDGCHLRESKVEADGLRVNDVDGAAVWASAHTRLVLGSLTSAGAGACHAETRGQRSRVAHGPLRRPALSLRALARARARRVREAAWRVAPARLRPPGTTRRSRAHR